MEAYNTPTKVPHGQPLGIMNGAGTVAAREGSALGNLDESLAQTAARLANQLKRATEAINRLLGAEVQPGNSDRTTAETPMPSDHVSRLDTRAGHLSQIATAFDYQMDRLERVTG